MKKFEDDDSGYLEWIRLNPSGYVVNTYRNPSKNYIILHKADCSQISSEKRDNWTSGQYIKVCSLNRSELEEWAEEGLNGTLEPCGFCKPFSRE